LLDVQIKALERQGKKVDAEELGELRARVQAGYEEQTDVRYAAARGWVDKVIDPAETRDVLIASLEIATRHAEVEPFKLGVFQV
jgi:3-methylcrotonyl-CoA carboxylase beta subunit